jgi:hypothetical protein
MWPINKFLQESIKYQLYIDMDQVLTNFPKKAYEVLGMDFDEHSKKFGESKTWSIINKIGVSFWSEMEWMPDGKKLWDYCKQYDPIILSRPSAHGSCILGKKIWIKKNLGSNIPYILERDKSKYAEPTSILIDDDIRNIKSWMAAKGIAIHHKNTKTTIEKIEKIFTLDQMLQWNKFKIIGDVIP